MFSELQIIQIWVLSGMAHIAELKHEFYNIFEK